MFIFYGKVHAPSLVINLAGCVEDIFRDCKVDHVVIFLGHPDGRSIEEDWGVQALAKEFTLETEEPISLLRFVPERVSGRRV